MKEFDYDLDYKSLDFTDAETRKLYRIGRGEQGVLLVRPYTNDICAHWRFRDVKTAQKSSDKIYSMFLNYMQKQDFIGMDMCANFWRWDLQEQDVMQITKVVKYVTRPPYYHTGDRGGVEVLPQESDALTSEKVQSSNSIQSSKRFSLL